MKATFCKQHKTFQWHTESLSEVSMANKYRRTIAGLPFWQKIRHVLLFLRHRISKGDWPLLIEYSSVAEEYTPLLRIRNLGLLCIFYVVLPQ